MLSKMSVVRGRPEAVDGVQHPAERRHQCNTYLLVLARRGRGPARAAGLDSVCDGAGTDLHLRLYQTVARRSAKFGKFAASHRLVHLFAPDPRLPVLCDDMAPVTAPALAGPAADCDGRRGRMGAR